MQQTNYLLDALAQYRTRHSWNERLDHWEKPASDSEEAMIERAAAMVRQSMSSNTFFLSESVQICAQGSYFNNTNVRQESDMDLRAVHPDILIKYGAGVVPEYAYQVLGYSATGKPFVDSAARLRRELATQLAAKFERSNIDDAGQKAIRITGIPGSRADIDIVPCFRLHYVSWNLFMNRYWTDEGIAILSKGGHWTLNFPDQHYQNGVVKRAHTRHRFKKAVRMLKRLRDELLQTGVIQAKDVPSFLVECLVYRVEDELFLFEEDDRYGRLLRVITRICEQLHDASWCGAATEINEIKPLFGLEQAWTLPSARKFAIAARQRLEA